MQSAIPETNFRLEHGFDVKPDLACDKGPGTGMVIGQNSQAAPTTGIFIGKLAETPYRPVWLDTRGAHVVYVVGKRRSGKSFTLGVLAEGLVSNTWLHQGDRSQGVLILDTMNVYMTMPHSLVSVVAANRPEMKEFAKWKLEHEEPQVTLFRPCGTQVPAGLPCEEVSIRPSDLGPEEWCALFGADPFADPLGHLIMELLGRVAEDGYISSQDGQRIPPKPDFILADLLTALDDDDQLQRYHRDTRESLRRRFDAIRRIPVFSDRGLDVRTLYRPGRISILLLRELDQQLRSVLVALIVKRTMLLRGISEQNERMANLHALRAEKYTDSDPTRSKSESEKAEEYRAAAATGLPRSWLIIDEAHNYIPSSGINPARRPLKKYVDEGRNLGLSIVVATQQPSGLDPSIQRNADVLLIHSLSHHDDITAASGMVNTAYPAEVIIDARTKYEGVRTFESLVRNLPLGYALASTDRANRLFPICVRPRVTVHGGTEY